MKIAMIEDDNTISFAVSAFLKRYDMETRIFDSLHVAENIDISHAVLGLLSVKDRKL